MVLHSAEIEFRKCLYIVVRSAEPSVFEACALNISCKSYTLRAEPGLSTQIGS